MVDPIYSAIDSFRNSTFVSYGLIWPSILVAAITVLRLKGQFSTKLTRGPGPKNDWHLKPAVVRLDS
jgi:hypothetical protein